MIFINRDLLKKIYKEIKNYDEIVLARHVSPDPDAIASQIALRDAIRLTFPNKKVYAVGAGVSKFKYLGSLDRLDYNSLTNALLIVLDVPNFVRVDGIEGLSYSKIIKIDHHPAEDINGDLDFTSSDYSSTAEMVADLLFETKFKMDKDIAEKLFLGIVSDSERFLFSNTKAHTFEVVVKLIKEYNLDFVPLYDNLYERNFAELKFEAYIINNITITDNKLGYIILDNKVLNEFNMDSSAGSTLVNNFHYINEMIAWCFVTYDERNEIFKVNIRSRGPIINEVASHFNGGGHKYASGARIYKKEDVDNIIKELDGVCEKYLDEEEK